MLAFGLICCRLLLGQIVAGFRIGLAIVLTCRLPLFAIVTGCRIDLAVVLLVVCF